MKNNLSLDQRNIQLREWLKNRDLLNLAALCRRINYNRGAFGHWLEGHKEWNLREDAVDMLETTLIDYGYKPN